VCLNLNNPQRTLVILMVLTFPMSCFSAVILHGNQDIMSSMAYHHATFDLTDGRFTIKQGGSLIITDSIIDITISAHNPFLANIQNGSLVLKNTIVNIKTSGMYPNPEKKALYQLITQQGGQLNVLNNTFDVTDDFTVGFIHVTCLASKSNIKINHNRINHFHGGIDLALCDEVEIDDNNFTEVSLANISYSGNHSQFIGNTFYFPGNLRTGNAINMVKANHIMVSHNIIASSASYGMTLMGVSDISIDSNKITDGQSYAIFINSPKFKVKFKHEKITNDNISISNNYFSQNKYGVAGDDILHLIINNNIFIQKFNDARTRQTFTDNHYLLPHVFELTWHDNLYKEAFTQENDGDNTSALTFIVFPKYGGVRI